MPRPGTRVPTKKLTRTIKLLAEASLFFFVVFTLLFRRIDINQNIFVNPVVPDSNKIIKMEAAPVITRSNASFQYGGRGFNGQRLVAMPGQSVMDTISLFTKRKKILFYTNFLGNPGFNFGAEPFRECQVPNCEMTNDKSLLNNSDAIIFHIPDLKSPNELPVDRQEHQKWVLMNESPMPTNLGQFNGTFNITMTYRIDSEVYNPEGYLVELTPDERNETMYNRTLIGNNYARGKSKLVAWYENSCTSQSLRQTYVKEMQKHAPIDTFGSCGTQKCDPDVAKCYKTIGEKYKFYLAFEDSLCKDYLSDKVWIMMQYNIVPVVLGAADYARFLPRNSYIDARNFKSAKALAQYLIKLDYGENLYNSYFEWKMQYKVVVKPWPGRFCTLCSHLNNRETVYSTKYNIQEWWDQCIPPAEFYRGVEDSLVPKTPAVKPK